MAFNDLRKGGRSSEPQTTGGVGALTAFIDQGSEFSGKLLFKDTVRIDGQFEGEISSENTLIVGESGLVKAKIESEMVVISGEVRGDIRAPGQVTLHKTARVFGNISTARLLVEDGALLNGQVKMESGRGMAASKEIPSPSPTETPKQQQEASKPNGKRAAV